MYCARAAHTSNHNNNNYYNKTNNRPSHPGDVPKYYIILLIDLRSKTTKHIIVRLYVVYRLHLCSLTTMLLTLCDPSLLIEHGVSVLWGASCSHIHNIHKTQLNISRAIYIL